MAESSTSICNQSLARIGSKRINDFDDASDTKPEAIYCRLFFDQTRRALLKDHYWPFAKSRVALSRDTEWDVDTDNDFGHTYAYHLPSDFLRLVLFYNGSEHPDGRTYYSYELEGKRLLTGETAVFLKYIKNITDVGAWDSLFIETMILLLSSKLSIPLTQEINVKQDIDKDLFSLIKKVRAMDRQEEQIIGRGALRTWRDARYSDIA
jgi:hypothetical protein